MASANKGSEAVKVVIRCRPLNGKETADGRKTIVEMDQKEGVIRLLNPKGDGEAPKSFTFDQVYDWNSTQLDIFDITARPLIDSAMEGYNGTIFAYGQTGTGKSHTMQGRDDPPELRGITPSAFNYVFEQISRLSEKFQYMVRASYIEIYNEEIRDLLSKDFEKKLELKESPEKGVYVKDLIQFVAKGPSELNNVLKVGQSHRVVAATNMNADSSRSHSIFTLVIECVEKFDAKATASKDDNSRIRMGKLNLVDLAGSERQNKTGATGDRLKEGIKINMSLTALGNVISALADGKSGHIPYRDSKLTRLLQDSLGGNTKTVMVANIGPADWNYDETLSTLRYANRAKNIQNKPRINEDPKDAMLREFQDEIKRLKGLLAARGGGGSAGGAGGRVVERVVEVEGDVEAVKAQLRKELEEKMKQHLSEEALQKAKAEAEAVARAQFEAIAADGSKTEEQRQRARGALKAQKEEMEHMLQQAEKEMKEKEALEAKIKAMESKVLSGGGENLLEKVDELKKRSEDLKREAEITKRQEEEQRRRKQELEMKQMDVNAKFESLEEEVQVKSKQLKKLFEKYQAKKSEIGDLQEQFQREREGLLEDYRILTQQIKLKNLIIACFIPPDYQDKIMQHCHWQDYEGAWNIDFLPYAGNAIRAHQDLARNEDGKNGTASGEDEKLANVYFSYSSLEDAYAATAGPGTGTNGRPGSSRRPGTASKRPGTASKGLQQSTSGRRDPTNIGTLRDSVAFNEAEEAEKRRLAASTPKARGLVKDTIDPRLRKSVAK
ncbi:hypothetical protein CEUSTIGMA_g5164.t1 [Chlamydomonas eustigma]|uniref:Kinesin-like protein n=1 Tax=Chlamydomonas eustigma TaxID=1157962 RepID=A0A250X3T6_9CHLO|nr:hypothetical protein CEUSTIGMA_g5164.t1 [Chlamydomonas eustigma]|eukprot:GAX77721.1 hypothetical protein CEUSTIGMA_g5164.t1 [Chlamydomonas eustigma]